MIGLIYLIGTLILLGGVGMLVMSFFVRKEAKTENTVGRDQYGRPVEKSVLVPASSKTMLLLANWKTAIATLLVGTVLTMSASTLFYAEQGYAYVIIKPSGKKDAIMSEGFHYKGLFAKVVPWQKYIDIKAAKGEMSDEVEGKMTPIPIRFVDQVTADMSVSTRFELPNDKEQFIKLAVKFRTMSNLVENTLKPTIKEQAIQTGYMYSAQDYISGSAQSFRQTFDEQLKDGTYKVQKKTYKDTTYIQDISDKTRKIRDISIRYVVEKVLKNGIPVRIPHEITENGIIVSQVIVDQITPDAGYQKRLSAQKAESAQRQLEQQKIETAKIAQQRIKAEGERNKEEERARQEKEQVKTLIAIETRLKEEETNKKLAEIKLKTQKIQAEQVKVKADADAYEIRKKVIAGITPEKRLQMELDAQVAKAEAVSKTKWPQYYFPGGGSSKGGDPMQLLILDAIKKK